MDRLQEKLATLPQRAGVYLLKSAKGQVLYVGKAARLDIRVRSYFGAGAKDHPKTRALIQHVEDLDTIVTDSDVEALLLEMTLIKEKRPAYNIRLKDDKRFPYLKVTSGETYPKAIVTRQTPADGSRHFGPYADVGALRQTLKTMRSIFPIRSCMGARPGRGARYRECLDYHIHRCGAPCIDKVSAADYQGMVEELCEFLGGDGSGVLSRLKKEMSQASQSLQYEKAAKLRDRIQNVERMMLRQRMMGTGDRDLDIVSVTRDQDKAFGVVMQVRGGRVLGKETRTLHGSSAATDAELLSAFVSQYYQSAEAIPKEIALPRALPDTDVLEAWLSQKRQARVSIRVPQRGRLAGLLRLAEDNARLALEENRTKIHPGGLADSVYALQKILKLNAPPVHIEGFDISNLQASQPVASLVVFTNGEPAKASYRKYRVQETDTPNDFAKMAEVVARRAKRIVAGEYDVPELIMVDGGPGQVSVAKTSLIQEGLGDVPLVGLAKQEEIIHPAWDLDPIQLGRSHPALKLLIRVRDEAHRFAVSYQRTRRKQRTLRSELDGIPGVGRERRKILLKSFGSVSGVRRASFEELVRTPGIPSRVAEDICRAFESGEVQR